MSGLNKTDRELLQQALAALCVSSEPKSGHRRNELQLTPKLHIELYQETIQALRTRLAHPESEPVAWKVWTVHNHIFFSIGVQTFQINDVLEHEPEVSAEEFSEWLATQLRHALTRLSNTAPPKKEWVGLTMEERDEINDKVYGWVPHYVAFHHAIEQALKEKNAA